MVVSDDNNLNDFKEVNSESGNCAFNNPAAWIFDNVKTLIVSKLALLFQILCTNKLPVLFVHMFAKIGTVCCVVCTNNHLFVQNNRKNTLFVTNKATNTTHHLFVQKI